MLSSYYVSSYPARLRRTRPDEVMDCGPSHVVNYHWAGWEMPSLFQNPKVHYSEDTTLVGYDALSLVSSDWYFGGACCLHLQDPIIAWYISSWFAELQRWRHFVPLKCQKLFTSQHSVMSQRTWISVSSGVRTSHLTFFIVFTRANQKYSNIS